MRALGKYRGASYSLDGEVIAQFALDDIAPEELESLNNELLIIEAKKYRQKRSLSANGYFWKLCDSIAGVLNTDKETIYLMMLKDYGTFDAYEITEESIEVIKSQFKFIEIIDSWKVIDEDRGAVINMCEVHGYRGSHDYDSKEFAKLLDGTISEANKLGIDTWLKEETDALIEQWRVTRGNT